MSVQHWMSVQDEDTRQLVSLARVVKNGDIFSVQLVSIFIKEIHLNNFFSSCMYKELNTKFIDTIFRLCKKNIGYSMQRTSLILKVNSVITLLF